MYSLVDKVALVTGGASGIGAGIVKELLKENTKFIAFLDINEAAGKEFVSEIISEYGDKKARFFKCDVTKDEELHEIFDKVITEFGGIDLVVNNAGICNETIDTYKTEIAVNLTAVISSTLKALDTMRADHGGKGGTVINISSAIALVRRSPLPFVYGATKSAVLYLSNAMGMEDYYKHTNVRIVTMCFGATDTDMMSSTGTYDEITRDVMINMNKYNRETNLIQSVQIAAEGVVQAYKNGKSGSTWLVNTSKVYDISDNVKEAYDIMSKNVAF